MVLRTFHLVNFGATLCIHLDSTPLLVTHFKLTPFPVPVVLAAMSSLGNLVIPFCEGVYFLNLVVGYIVFNISFPLSLNLSATAQVGFVNFLSHFAAFNPKSSFACHNADSLSSLFAFLNKS